MLSGKDEMRRFGRNSWNFSSKSQETIFIKKDFSVNFLLTKTQTLFVGKIDLTLSYLGWGGSKSLSNQFPPRNFYKRGN